LSRIFGAPHLEQEYSFFLKSFSTELQFLDDVIDSPSSSRPP